ncbi:MAG: peptide deformylase [Patescibacteria group bacterium]
MILKIVNAKNPVLRQIAKPVEKVDKKVLQLVKDMKETLYAQKDPEGVGLAAPQVGKSLRIFLMKYKKEERVIINPEILSRTKHKKQANKTKDKHDILEGCLSLPHFYGPIKRDASLKLKYLNEKGEQVVELFDGFLAQIIEHEFDHLEGILFVDHILKQKAPLYKFKGKEWEEVELS